MERTHSSRPGAEFDRLVATAARAGAPASVAEEARRVTAARFAAATRDGSSTGRAEAYFWGVVRRRALRGDAPAIARSLLVTSLAADLADAGHTPDAVAREVARVYGGSWAGACAAPGDGRAA